MKKIMVVTGLLAFLISSVGIHHALAQPANETTQLKAQITELKTEIAALNAKLDKVLENHTQFFEEFKRIRFMSRR